MSRSATLWSLPGVRVVARIGPLRVLRVLAVLYVLGFTAAVLLKEPIDPLSPGRDPVTYLAAGERLNDGHPLYALSPGDRPVPLSPPHWSVPLLAPPPIAVLWRPIAVAGEAGALGWWVAGVGAIVLLTAWLLTRGGAVVLVATVAATPALALTALSGNASALLVPLLAVAWLARDRPWVVGTIVAVAAVVKLTPALLVLWLIGARRWRAVGAVVAVGALIALVGLAGAGVENHLEWLRTVPDSAPMPLSIAARTGWPAIVVAGVVAGVVVVGIVVAARRGQEGALFALAIAGAALATPAFYFAALASLVVAVVPLIDRRRRAPTA